MFIYLFVYHCGTEPVAGRGQGRGWGLRSARIVQTEKDNAKKRYLSNK